MLSDLVDVNSPPDGMRLMEWRDCRIDQKLRVAFEIVAGDVIDDAQAIFDRQGD
jgi:hypothetical protein